VDSRLTAEPRIARRVVSVRALAASVGIAALVASAAAAAAGEVTVARHVVNGMTFTLSASDSSSGSYCITMRKQGELGASGCGSLFAGKAHGVSYLAHDGRPAPDYIAGPVVSAATHVSVTLANGSHLSIPTIPPPAGLTRNVRFYVHFMPCTSIELRQVVGLNAAGGVVAWLRLPAAASGPHAAC
jgi:hypothetical protein